MRTATVLLSTILLAFVLSSFKEQGKWIIDPTSRLSIHGSTNINSFKCLLSNYQQNDTLEYQLNGNSIDLKFSKNRMSIPIKGFDCGNKQITNDFLKTLKSDKYPDLAIYFRCFKNNTIKDNTYIDGVVDITLAGATKRYVVRYHARTPSRDMVHLTGIQAVNFGDFQLEPPQKMMGLIQVQECLEVEFNLLLKAL